MPESAPTEASKHGYDRRTKLGADVLKSCSHVLERADDPQEKTGGIAAARSRSQSSTAAPMT